ncbi:MAG TPA: phosphate acyltransferase PlsX [Clostridiales bacterium]|nr:phosphate acyltransferase PlsX [Clostridiales bacterium]
MKIIVDAMGGDNAPHDIVKGCLDAVKEQEGFNILLLGDGSEIDKILKENRFSSGRIDVQHTTEVITNDDIPTKSIKVKKDSSMVVGFNMLKENKGDVFISAGNTGALMTGATFILGRIEGIDRPALAPVIPTKKGGALLIDAGFNTVCKPLNYLQFGIMGSVYMREIFKISNPKIGLINVGAEERKGSEIIRQAYNLLSASGLNFIGNIEGREIPEGEVDVAVCDGFVGNVLLKFLEGVGSFIFDGLKDVYYKNFISKLASLLVKGELRKFKKRLDYEEYGGVPVLGINGTVFKCHGNSNAKSFKNALIKAYYFAKTAIMEQIKQEISCVEVRNVGM